MIEARSSVASSSAGLARARAWIGGKVDKATTSSKMMVAVVAAVPAVAACALAVFTWAWGHNRCRPGRADLPPDAPADHEPVLSGGGADTSQQAAPAQTRPLTPADRNDPQHQFASAILHSTEDVWGQYFQASGQQYEQPKLLLFHGQTRSGCGAAEESMGPFYCPADHRVYLDLDFFQEMDTRFHASGDFARAYVIAHEVGHHVQNMLGIIPQIDQARRQGQPMEGAAGLSCVRNCRPTASPACGATSRRRS